MEEDDDNDVSDGNSSNVVTLTELNKRPFCGTYFYLGKRVKYEVSAAANQPLCALW